MNDYLFDSLKMQTKAFSNGGYGFVVPPPFAVRQLDALYFPGFLSMLRRHFKELPSPEELYPRPPYIP